MVSFQLQKAIFIPRSVQVTHVWPFGQMSVGDTFLIPNTDLSRALGAAQYWKRQYGIKVSYRREGKKFRFWRVV